MKRLRIIGDVHGKIDKYFDIMQDANAKGLYTLQVGDLGFVEDYVTILEHPEFDPHRNKCFLGNHDAYNYVEELGEFCLGDYGLVNLNGVELFFVRGAFTIDGRRRIMGVDWFPIEEEIDPSCHPEILAEYKRN